MIEEALVFICSAVILVPICKRLGLGSVLGYLLAGLAVGPYGLRLIQDSESILHFAELGVVLLLFIIGLEIQPRKLWAMRRHLFGLGGTQIILTTLCFFGIGVTVGLSPLSAGVIGFGLSLSSTAFALQTLAERNQLNTEHGRSSFSVLLMQDLTAIPVLAIIPILGVSPTTEGPTMGGLLTAAAIVSFLFIASRFLIRPAFRFIASTNLREIFTAATLLIVLGVAVLMQKAGLSAALGTFIAGVLLADSEYRHELESDLEPFKSLLMGLFFIAVGMSVSLDLLVQRPLFIFSLATGYLLLKFGLIYGSARLFTLKHENAKMMGLTIAQGGEFAFVIFTVAQQGHLVSTEIAAILVAVVTLTMTLNPFLMIAHDKWLAHRSRKVLNPQYDEIKDESPEVIVAGFGRFGQIFGRILRAQNIPFVAIDHDPDQIELLRRFGNKVYYGDASRAELLETAGAAKAKFFILAIDDTEMSLETVRTVKTHFPHLVILARARNRGHMFDLKEEGIRHIKRETFDSSVSLVGDLLTEMGFEPQRVEHILGRFKRHDEIMLEEQFKVRSDDKMFITVSNQGVAQLAQVLQQDSVQTYVDPENK